jgi:hypothetical protein
MKGAFPVDLDSVNHRAIEKDHEVTKTCCKRFALLEQSVLRRENCDDRQQGKHFELKYTLALRSPMFSFYSRGTS